MGAKPTARYVGRVSVHGAFRKCCQRPAISENHRNADPARFMKRYIVDTGRQTHAKLSHIPSTEARANPSRRNRNTCSGKRLCRFQQPALDCSGCLAEVACVVLMKPRKESHCRADRSTKTISTRNAKALSLYMTRPLEPYLSTSKEERRGPKARGLSGE